MRAELKNNGYRTIPPVIKGQLVAGGWLSGPKHFQIVIKGRERLLGALDNFRDSPARGLMAAFSLGERWRVDSDTRDRLRRTGTYHLLAISGVHVGAAILPLLFIMRLYVSTSHRTRPRVVQTGLLVLSVFAVGTYISFTGFSASALRATVYFILMGSTIIAGRGSLSMVNLSWCVLVIICFSATRQPHISLALSALAVTGIILSGRGGGNLLSGAMRVTMGAVLFTLPVVVWLAGGISIIAPMGNLVAGIPFGLFLIPAAVLIDFAAMLPWFPLEPFIKIWIKVAGLVLKSMAHLADIPFAFHHLSPAGCLTASVAAVTGLFMWYRKGHRLAAGMSIFIIIVVLSGASQFLSERIGRDKLIVSFPIVGQADAAIVRHQGRTVLIDSGPPGLPGRDSPVARALLKLGISKVDAVFLSHPHPDHTGGLKDIIARWPVEVIYLPDGYTEVKMRGISSDGIFGAARVRTLKKGDLVRFSSMTLTVLGPPRVESLVMDANRKSMQLLLETGEFSGLFTGDAGWDQVTSSLEKIQRLNLLKIPHHGSKIGFPPPGLDGNVIRLSGHGNIVAVCPSGPPRNRHLPATEVVKWFEQRGITLVYTGDYGVNIRYKME